MNHVREKVKPLCTYSYKENIGEGVYDPFLGISLYSTLTQLKYFLGEIHHCVIVVGEWIFTVVFLFLFLSQKKIWTTVALMITGKRNG